MVSFNHPVQHQLSNPIPAFIFTIVHSIVLIHEFPYESKAPVAAMANATDSKDPPSLDKQRHIKYWERCHSTFLPSPYTAYDSTRLTFACFTISALDLLSVPLTPADRAAIRRWVLSLQHPDGGFCGSSTHSYAGQDARKGTANLAASFFALILLGLAADGEDEERAAFAGVDRAKLLRWIRTLQRKDGSFGQNVWDGETVGGRDMRHSYLASCIRWMLRGDVQEGDEAWVEDVDVDEMVAHVRRGQVSLSVAFGDTLN